MERSSSLSVYLRKKKEKKKSWSKFTTANILTAILVIWTQAADNNCYVWLFCWWDVWLKTARPLRSSGASDKNSPFLHFSGPQEWSAKKMTSYFQQKFSSLHPGSAKKNLLHSMFLFIYLFCLTSTVKKKPKTSSPRMSFVVIRHRCVNYWKSVFFSRVLWDRLQELGCNSIPPRKKSFKLEGDLEINRLMLTWANEGATPVGDQPNQSKRKDHLQPAHSQPPLGFPVIIPVQSPIPSGPKAENFPEEMVFREQWTGTVWSIFFSFHGINNIAACSVTHLLNPQVELQFATLLHFITA